MMKHSRPKCRPILITLMVIEQALFFSLLAIAFIQALNIVQTWREYRHMESSHRLLQEKLSTIQAKNVYMAEFIEEMETNPDFAGRIIREKLNYLRPEETLLRFKRYGNK